MASRKYLTLLSLSGFLVAIDQLTKNAVVAAFKLGESRAVFEGFFHISRVHNSGAAFGLLTTLPPQLRDPFFFLVPSLTLLVILYVFHKLKDAQFLNIYALSLIVGGALGNLADRIRLGYVVDFLDFHWNNGMHFPTFNLADTAISAGVGLLVLGMLFERDEDDKEDASLGSAT